MNKSKKNYKKALLCFQKGYIDKAISLCEKSISIDIRNNAALDLKGMLLYFKGNLDEANAIWKLNAYNNNDGAAKKYLEDISDDKKRLNYYIKALKCIKRVEIEEALEFLDECSKSSYNCINVNNNMALCYMKQGKYQKAISKIEDVLKIDINNEMALKNKKELVHLGIMKNRIDTGKIFKTLTAIIIVIVMIFGAFEAKNYIKNRKVSIKKTPSKKIIKKETPKSKVKTPIKKKKVVKQEIFNGSELQKAVDNKDFNKIYEYEEKWKDKSSLGVNDKVLISKALDVLTSDGVQYFYKNGTNLIQNKDYEGGKQSLLKAYKYGEKSYLYSDIIYFLAEAYKNTNDAQNAINYYSMYDQKFSKGSYEETVLYNLAILNKDVNIEAAKRYANKLSNSYPESIYNNSNISDIINR
ncbi:MULTISPECIES: tetratricopeptide repeat protein [Clostridium]|uniref:tetratricopeptide repeat protein n=1 Tax=Clostridium TaxID=1485 RepID=UPI0008241003|nr:MULTISPECIES: tetratricopeptide repeat protein [Clostridium]PJI08920.1 hypothetical protein CUB90_14085 [Clostridium sp. CT7]